MIDTTFEGFPKIPRLKNFSIMITEKIDGTNAQVIIPEDPTAPILVGSRNRYIYAGQGAAQDNFGFAQWAADHETELRRLGPGRHFGEWWGPGIGRRYNITERRWSLFNARRWTQEELTERGLVGVVSVVPILKISTLDELELKAVVSYLFSHGSVAAPGWDKPEGVVVSFGDTMLKITDNGDMPKWMVA